MTSVMAFLPAFSSVAERVGSSSVFCMAILCMTGAASTTRAAAVGIQLLLHVHAGQVTRRHRFQRDRDNAQFGGNRCSSNIIHLHGSRLSRLIMRPGKYSRHKACKFANSGDKPTTGRACPE